ncbi:MAG: hypothetical protein ACYC61_25160, partial [Isosphaeraceae bacterium]
MRRLSIIGMMRLVILAAVGLTALRGANKVWAGVMLTLALGMTGIALLGAIFRHGRARAWWVGFSLFCGGYLVPAIGPWFRTEIRPVLVTTQLLEYIQSAAILPELAPPTPVPAPPPARPIEYLSTGAAFFNRGMYEEASRYLNAAHQYRDQLEADEQAMLCAYLTELAEVS